MKKTIALVITLFFLLGCKSSVVEYKPIDGYNGKIKQITTYEFKNLIEKQQQIAKYGLPIPMSIKNYNEGGYITKITGVETDDESDVLFIVVDSTRYNEDFTENGHNSYMIWINPKDVKDLQNTQALLSHSVLHIDVISTIDVVKRDDKKVELWYGSAVMDKKAFDDWNDEIKTQFFEVLGKQYPELIERGVSKPDTTIIESLYNEGKLISKSLIRTASTIDKKKWEIKFVRDTSVYKYDENERIYYKKELTKNETITFLDTTSMSIIKDVDIYDPRNAVSLSIKNSHGRELYKVKVEVANETDKTNEVIQLLEKFRDGLISESEMCNQVKDIVYNIDKSKFSEITKFEYDKYDDHKNPLQFTKNQTVLSNYYSNLTEKDTYVKLLMPRDVFKQETKVITEEEIIYYE